jgi:hypothetical protein
MNELRLFDLERKMLGMQSEINSLRRQFVPQNVNRRTRIAKIVTEPYSDDSRKFGVIFQDGKFDDSSTLGDDEATFVDRLNTYEHVAYNLGDQQPTNGERVVCYDICGQWWFAKGVATTSTPIAVASAKRLYQSPRWWTDPGGVEETSDPGLVLSTASDSWRMSFNNQDGPSITGLTHNPAVGGNNFTVSESMSLMVEIQIMLVQAKLDTPTEPDPPEQYRLSITAETSSDQYNSLRPTGRRIIEFPFSTEWDGDGGVLLTSVVYGNILNFDHGIVALSGFVPMKFSVTPPTVRTFGIKLSRFGGTAEDPTDYGFQVLDMILSITRLS